MGKVEETLAMGTLIMRVKISDLPRKVLMGVVRMLPRQVIYWAAIRMWAHASTGPWGWDEATGITLATALRRWEGKVEPAEWFEDA